MFLKVPPVELHGTGGDTADAEEVALVFQWTQIKRTCPLAPLAAGKT